MHKNNNSKQPYVTNRAFKMTMQDLQYYNNAMRIMRETAGFGSKGKVTMRDLVMKLIRTFVNQNMDMLRRLWAEDQARPYVNKNLPKITLNIGSQ